MELINHKNAETYVITQRTSSKVTLILVLYDFSSKWGISRNIDRKM
jgi:hypothetical protein